MDAGPWTDRPSVRERRCRLPGDDIVPRAGFVATHAVTISAPPDAVWPWLMQMGWHRAGWYTPHWVDRLLFPANRPSAQQLIAELQSLRVGDFVPDGPPQTRCGFVVDRLDPNHHLVLHSDSHLPLRWRVEGKASVDWTWAFVLRPLDRGARTRLLVRWRIVARPWWLLAGCWAVIAPADMMMTRAMLRGIRSRVLRH
jgi:hypothetical protein